MAIRWHTCARKFCPAAAVALWGVLAEPTLARAAGATDASCPPSAIVAGADGTEGMVASVVTLLRQHGVGSPAAACGGRVVRASLNRDLDARFHLLHIDDGFGRTSDRRIADANMAASLIESWALGEDAYLLSPRAPAADVPAVAPPGVAAVADVDVSAVRPAGPGAGSPWRLTAAAELSNDVNGHSLYGGVATGCARVGASCVGGRARWARGGGQSALTSSGFTSYDWTRTAAELMAVATWPVTLRRFGFAPLLGLGAGRERVTAVLTEPFSVSRADVSLRAEAAVMGGVRLGAHVSILAEVGASIGKWVSGDATTAGAVLLPPAPAAALRAAIGIEYAR